MVFKVEILALLVIVVGITCLLLFSIRYYRTEGFADLLSVETPFVDKQSVAYQNYNKDIMTTPNVDNMASALVTPDVFLPMNIVESALIAKRLIPDPTNKYTDYDNKYCRGALQPANLPPHKRRARDGCGWWYVSDPTLTSTGVLGTIDGPVFTDNLPGGGQWIWDLKKAQELEDIKACKQITACEVIDTDNIHLRCGFCPNSGYAVPIKTDGSEKYTTNPAGTCGTKLILSGDKCPSANTYEPVIADDGTDCKTYGYPSPDNSIRLYSEADCDAMNGRWVPNGECLMLQGGSYSAACKGLNKPVKKGNVCSPEGDGRLTAACLLLLTRSLGYTDLGAMRRIIKNNGSLDETDKVAIAQLANVGVSVPKEILNGGGAIDKNTAANLYMRIKEQIRVGIHTRVREAAKWFVVGTPDFNPCDFDKNEMGPFPKNCLQQLWRMNGCQAAGTSYPNDKNVQDYAFLSWGGISNKFKYMYDSMALKTDPVAQDERVKKCLGIDVTRPEAKCK
jgi:hypothetical protein